jgi:hypothetical protein
MDIVFLALTLIAALTLPRSRALIATAAAWAVCMSFVAWGPAHNSDVHTDSIGFWGPWLIVLVIGGGLVVLVDFLRRRRTARA